ncbi:alpha/beta hydrolase [Phycicoccus avicenniae]|uniref:alpha/beta hydrolase n=1 Tax=Phycicoccus avicenniae TaxID=2828860 RepID=UPI003D2761C6
MSRPTRRTALGAGLGVFATAAVGCSRDLPGTEVPRDVEVERGTLRSPHLPGRDLPWVLAVPSADDTARPPVVVLHGKGGHAEQALTLLGLAEHVAATGLAVAAVDGGDGYWHGRRDGTDAGRMVLEDFLPLVARAYAETSRVAFLGWSMGGYGSLLLASELGPDRVAAVVTSSAALWTSPGASAHGAFDDRDDFVAHDVFADERLATLASLPVRLDCGREDPFAAANRAFGRALPGAALSLDAGGHSGAYWRGHGGAQLRWIRARVDEAGAL